MSSPSPSPTWQTVRYKARWAFYDGSLRPGQFKATISARVRNPPSDVIFPAGLWQQGELNTDLEVNEGWSLDIRLPAEDDPDIGEHGWYVELVITFTGGGAAETYHLVPDIALAADPDGIDLVDVVLPQQLPEPQPIVIKGVPNGYAGLDGDGDVVDAAGVKVLPYVVVNEVPTTWEPGILYVVRPA